MSSLYSSIAPAAAPLTWSQAWAQSIFRFRLLLALLLLLVISYALPFFFAYIQARPGYVVVDPLLALLPAHDVSLITFAVIYGGVAVALVYLLPRPLRLLRVLWAYALLHLLRVATLWLVPLEPPAQLVVLHDTLVETFFYVSAEPITKDLFFSGHTATLALLALAVPYSALRRLLVLLTVVVALLVLVQHAHYTYDVLAAPFFAGFSFWLAKWLVPYLPRSAASQR